ncbi:MAG: penicillin-binding protein activator LpoB [Labilithrix sp.]
MALRFLRNASIALGFGLLALQPGCGKEVVRGSDDPSVDRAAVSTSLDKEDMKRALKDTLNKFRASDVMTRWRTENPKPTVAVFPFQNTTSEHIESQLDTILSETEAWILEAGTVRIIDQRRQAEYIRQVENSQNAVFDPKHIPQYGKQMGAKYVITGHVSGNDERNEDMRRIQYFIYLEVVEVATSEKLGLWKSEITKAVR